MANISRWDPFAGLTRWDPFSELTSLQDRVNQLLTPSSAPLWRLGRGVEPTLAVPSFIPMVDVFEDEDQIVVTAELPGLEEKDVNISLEDRVLTISGERKMENEEKRDNFQRIERSYGRFTRSFTLPATVDEEDVKAEFANGVLKITLGKHEEAKPKQIKIEVGKPAAARPGKAA
jgi:HSP20 family protein